MLLGPEERHRVEPFARTEHVASGRLTLPFGDDPVLDADLLAAQPIGPSCDVASGPNPGNARLEIRVDGDTAIDRDTGLLGEHSLGPHADADDHKVGVELFPAPQGDAVSIECSGCGPEMEDDAMLRVDLAHEVTDFLAEHVFHRPRLRGDDMHVEPPGAQ